ncbi:hypothetical protein MVES1_001701 [Malassezia vespertilionis]|uniref:XPG N-terminal domain-containing protein n=1 Tax=Malassezia vespertilionis TaxID=2020962 RepID=A0A2N1JCW3_9BASI|nr:uncharacterized protein MVES1_001701 [Malassezia vespertilionis]PKI84385.1 hypothetical protein MVES_001600 [Malassezia vespertilionis]WFD06356.1 hypothetical protein MVES1_001701 [Malassezia vespertilionis]
MIRGLEGFLQGEQLLQSGKLLLLKNTRLGIDLSYYLRQLLSSANTAEPLVAGVGGQPLALVQHIESDLQLLEQHRIVPVFVLNGLSPAKRTRPFSYEDRRPGLRTSAWEAYEADNVALANQHFGASNSIHYPDLYRTVLRMLRHKRVEFLVAPYLAVGQLALLELHPKQYVHAIYGPLELLAFDHIERVILSIDVRAATFQFVSKAPLLRALQVTADDFLDVALLAGMEFCSTFPPLQDESTGVQQMVRGHPNIQAIAQLVKNARGGFNLCRQYADHPMVAKTAYLDQFCHARTMIKDVLVLSPESGTVVPLPLARAAAGGAHVSAGEIPSDLHEVFSFRLPDEVFLYLSRGMMSPSVLGSLLSGYVIEPAPLDGGQAKVYHRFVREFLTESPESPRCVAVALACAALHPFWRARKVAAVYWFQPGIDYPVPHEAPATQKLLARNEQWMVRASLLDEELRRQNSATIDFSFCLAATADEARAARTIAASEPNEPMQKKDEVVANAVWRFLSMRNILSEKHTHTVYGEALYAALQTLRVNDKLKEPLYLAIELIRAHVLNNAWYDGVAHSGGPSFGSEQEMQHMLLVMRAASLISLQCKPQKWDAPLSRELLVFNSFVKSLTRSLRSLVEMATLGLLLKGDARKPRVDGLDISLSLPFQTDTNTGMGILFKCYIDALYTLQGGAVKAGEEEEEEVKEAKDNIVEMLVETFDNVRDVPNELKRAFRFWEALMVAVQVLAGHGAIPAALAAQFEDANAWLRPMAP